MILRFLVVVCLGHYLGFAPSLTLAASPYWADPLSCLDVQVETKRSQCYMQMRKDADDVMWEKYRDKLFRMSIKLNYAIEDDEEFEVQRGMKERKALEYSQKHWLSRRETSCRIELYMKAVRQKGAKASPPGDPDEKNADYNACLVERIRDRLSDLTIGDVYF